VQTLLGQKEEEMKNKIIPKVVQGEKEVAIEVLADSIVAISQGIKKIKAGRP
jgi:hypothetical protein